LKVHLHVVWSKHKGITSFAQLSKCPNTSLHSDKYLQTRTWTQFTIRITCFLMKYIILTSFWWVSTTTVGWTIGPKSSRLNITSISPRILSALKCNKNCKKIYKIYTSLNWYYLIISGHLNANRFEQNDGHKYANTGVEDIYRNFKGICLKVFTNKYIQYSVCWICFCWLS